MQTRTGHPANRLKSTPNPRGNQTQPAPKPAVPRTQNGCFTPRIPPKSAPNPNTKANLAVTRLNRRRYSNSTPATH